VPAVALLEDVTVRKQAKASLQQRVEELAAAAQADNRTPEDPDFSPGNEGRELMQEVYRKTRDADAFY
jgi:hypothetical protein